MMRPPIKLGTILGKRMQSPTHVIGSLKHRLSGHHLKVGTSLEKILQSLLASQVIGSLTFTQVIRSPIKLGTNENAVS